MVKLTTTIDGIHGDIKIVLAGDKKLEYDLKWCEFDDAGSVGFITSFSPTPVIITEVAAEHFIRIIISILIRDHELKPGDLTIINHMGEVIPDIQFLPPTFIGNEAELTSFVAMQDSLTKLYSVYEQFGRLDEELVGLATEEGIIDDFLSLVQLRATGIFLTVKQPSQ